MSPGKMFVAEMQHEAANTRKLLEVCPPEKFDWKPHEKSMTLGHLAGHIAENPGWAAWMIPPELDFATADYQPFTPTTTEDLLAKLDDSVKSFVESVGAVSDEDFQADWTMRQGEKVMMTLPRAVAIRGWLFSHWCHHRGQLTVYLRLLDVPLPSIYGPTADNPDF